MQSQGRKGWHGEGGRGGGKLMGGFGQSGASQGSRTGAVEEAWSDPV